MLKSAAIILFISTYALLLIFPKRRAHIAFFSAAVFVASGILPIGKVLSAVDFNVLLMIAGTMGIVSMFIESKMPALLGDLIIIRAPDIRWAIISLSLFAGIVSAFIDNVATVLMIAPVALTISKKLRISPIPGIIAISISSNLQGAATLVGDTTSILLGGQAELDFFDFFYFHGRMGMFFVVQISALTSAVVLLLLFRKYDQPIRTYHRERVTDYFPTYLLLGMIALLIIASFVPAYMKPDITNGLICMALFIVGLLRVLLLKKDKRIILTAIREIDYFTLILLAGLFVVIGGITHVGAVEDISGVFVDIGNDNLFVIYTVVVWFSVLLSAVIDNIPYVATMLPVVAGIADMVHVSPFILYFGLLTGATLGGNLTPIGASANITALGILRKNGCEVKARDFMRISVPFTLTAVLTGYVLIWIIWR